MYISPVDNVRSSHSLRYRQYADDTQHAIRPSNDDTFKRVSMCVEDVARRFLENELLLNPAKTEAVLFGTKVQRYKIMTASGTDVAGTEVPFRDSVKLLGVRLDSALTMDRHVTEVIRSCSYHTRALRHIRPLLSACTRRRQHGSPQYRVIAPRLRQRTATRHHIQNTICWHSDLPISPHPHYIDQRAH